MSVEKTCVLIAGGSGLIGKRLCDLLYSKGYEVRILSRKKNLKSKYKVFQWDPAEHEIEMPSLENVTAVINLAGTGIADHSWSASYKREILQSRVDAATTLLNAIKNSSSVKSYVTASAIGYYGDQPRVVLTETDKPGKGFLSETVIQWEEASKNCTTRRVVIRTGIVLSKSGGALPPLARSVKAMIAPVINGSQVMSWIHIDDLCRIYIEAVENEKLNGVINAVAPSNVSHEEFVITLKKFLNPSAIKIKVPVAFIKLLMGERSNLILDSADVRPDVLLGKGFSWNFPDLDTAIKNLYVF